jgi:hypothetical protein
MKVSPPEEATAEQSMPEGFAKAYAYSTASGSGMDDKLTNRQNLWLYLRKVIYRYLDCGNRHNGCAQ